MEEDVSVKVLAYCKHLFWKKFLLNFKNETALIPLDYSYDMIISINKKTMANTFESSHTKFQTNRLRNKKDMI